MPLVWCPVGSNTHCMTFPCFIGISILQNMTALMKKKRGLKANKTIILKVPRESHLRKYIAFSDDPSLHNRPEDEEKIEQNGFHLVPS